MVGILLVRFKGELVAKLFLSFFFFFFSFFSFSSVDRRVAEGAGCLGLVLQLSREVGVSWLCHCPGIMWEPIRKRAHTQLVRETLRHSGLSSLSHCGLILT